MEFVLQEWQMVLLVGLASVLVQIIRFVFNKLDKPINELAIQILVFVISLVFGVWWGGLSFPNLPSFVGEPMNIAMDVVNFLGLAIAIIGQLLGVAYVVYKVLLKHIFDAIEPLRI